ncbi:hypothetical protein ACNA06_05395 [Lysinibacillus sp. RSDA_15]|uniref:hypothetical protein n=1 Tax=Lysinibacillus sp. RSDA_15 TaxID=3391421 RepID=UPI003A4E4579
MRKVLCSLFFVLILSILSFNSSEVNAAEKVSNRAESIVEIGKLLGLDGTQRATQLKMFRKVTTQVVISNQQLIKEL